MQIISVIPEQHNGPSSTTIHAQTSDGQHVYYNYSHTYELLRDSVNPHEWAQWNGGSLTDAIQWVIALK